MFVLLDTKTGGVYAVRDDESVDRVVQMFVDKDDAVRYYEMLKDLNYTRELEVKEIEETQVKDNCVSYGYRFTVITPDDIVIPPPL
jgi:flagellar biosynthesis regulator FlaF|tara:strand:+ start:5200 stop:5457 length:258 start_codon:yes stop_codon:yes gene_type:complete